MEYRNNNKHTSDFVAFLMPIKTFLLFVSVSIFLVSLLSTSCPASENSISHGPYKIGVLAYKGKEAAVKRWGAHGLYLNQKLAPLKFEIVPLTYTKNELSQAVINRLVSFVITNPGQYTELELGGHVSRLATRHMSGAEGIINQFGGAAIARSDRLDLNSYTNLTGKKILIPSRSSLGGWQVHLREALSQGVDLRLDAEIVELKNHKKVVMAILAGEADVGFVRSGLIEELVAGGEIRLDDIKVIEQKDSPYPYLLSTRLYPEWPFAVVSGTSNDLAGKVLHSLLDLSADDNAAIAAGIQGWTIPGHYSTVNELFRETGLGPYTPRPPTLKSIIYKYLYEILVAVFIFILLLITTLWTKRTNKLLQQEIQDRKQAEEEREKLIKQLQETLAEIKTLSGLLPICASCKKIRDDKGYWNQIESYIMDHSEAQFSHSICHECAKKLYPEFVDENGNVKM